MGIPISAYASGSFGLRVDSPLFSTIVFLFQKPAGFRGFPFLERRIPGKNGEGAPRVYTFTARAHAFCADDPFWTPANL